jgi:hypothetical protein
MLEDWAAGQFPSSSNPSKIAQIRSAKSSGLSGLPSIHRGEADLKGFEEAVRLFEVRWA